MKYKITLDKRRAKKDGRYPVVLQIINRDKIRISTPYSAFPEMRYHTDRQKTLSLPQLNKRGENLSLKKPRETRMN